MRDEDYYQHTNSCYIKKIGKTSMNEKLRNKEIALNIKEREIKKLEARLKTYEAELEERENRIKQKEEELNIESK